MECTAIIHKTLGDPIDIHSGAVDLIGTHHTNEMAQTEAAFEHKLANYWVHGEHLLVEGQKMAKSAGNFYTLIDIVKRGYDPLALRLLYLQSHYRSQLNFTWESLESAAEFLRRLRAWADLKFQPELGHKKNASGSYDGSLRKMAEALKDDLNTAQALAMLAKLADLAEQEGVNITRLHALLEGIDDMLGLQLSKREDITKQQKEVIKEREQARQTKNWQKADELRSRLAKQGIEINDTPHGPVWSHSQSL